MRTALLTSLVLLVTVATADAGLNRGTRAYLTWSSANHTTTNTASGPSNNLWLRLERDTVMTFLGCELDVVWSPTREESWVGCFERLGTFYPTSSGTTC